MQLRSASFFGVKTKAVCVNRPGTKIHEIGQEVNIFLKIKLDKRISKPLKSYLFQEPLNHFPKWRQQKKMRQDTIYKQTAGQDKAPPPPASGQQSTAAPKKATRTRAAVSMERRLTLVIIALLAAFESKDANKIKASLDNGRILVKDVEEKIVGPAKKRVAEIQAELQAAVKDPANMDARKIKELSQELARHQKKLEGLTA